LSERKKERNHDRHNPRDLLREIPKHAEMSRFSQKASAIECRNVSDGRRHVDSASDEVLDGSKSV